MCISVQEMGCEITNFCDVLCSLLEVCDIKHLKSWLLVHIHKNKLMICSNSSGLFHFAKTKLLLWPQSWKCACVYKKILIHHSSDNSNPFAKYNTRNFSIIQGADEEIGIFLFRWCQLFCIFSKQKCYKLLSACSDIQNF